MKHIYGIFGYQFSLELSTRPEGYLGDLEIWNSAEKTLQVLCGGVVDGVVDGVVG